MGNNILRLTLLSMKDGSISYPTPYVGETEERFQFKNWIRFIKLNPTLCGIFADMSAKGLNETFLWTNNR